MEQVRWDWNKNLWKNKSLESNSQSGIFLLQEVETRCIFRKYFLAVGKFKPACAFCVGGLPYYKSHPGDLTVAAMASVQVWAHPGLSQGGGRSGSEGPAFWSPFPLPLDMKRSLVLVQSPPHL